MSMLFLDDYAGSSGDDNAGVDVDAPLQNSFDDDAVADNNDGSVGNYGNDDGDSTGAGGNDGEGSSNGDNDNADGATNARAPLRQRLPHCHNTDGDSNNNGQWRHEQ